LNVPLGKGVVILDYPKLSMNELSVKKGEMVSILKRAGSWVFLESNGTRGWVPLCYVSESG
jgi:hypothetical protein